MPRRARACERLPAGVRKQPCVSTPLCARTHRRTAVRVPSPHVAASTLVAAPRSGPAPWGTRYRVASDLSSIRASTMEGVCALRHGWSTFRRPGTKRARVQHPLEYRFAVPSRTKTKCGGRVLCWCECVARTGAYAFHCTAGRTMHVAGISPITRSTARSPPRCRRSSC